MLTYIDREPGDTIPVSDRGYLYGDGAFETLRVLGGRLLLWNDHWRRLRRACDLLQLNYDIPSQSLRRFIEECCQRQELEDAVVRITVSRDSAGARGYSAQPSATVREVIQLSPFNLPAALNDSPGIDLDLLEGNLMDQGVLADLKHLNRLPQVLLSHELASRFDGVVCSADGHIIETTRANLFYCLNNRWLTPDLRGCGVAGTLRAFVCDPERSPLGVGFEPLLRANSSNIQAAVWGNSVFGCWPVARLAGRQLDTQRAVVEFCRPVRAKAGFDG